MSEEYFGIDLGDGEDMEECPSPVFASGVSQVASEDTDVIPSPVPSGEDGVPSGCEEQDVYEEFIPEGYYFRDDLDGGRLIKKEVREMAQVRLLKRSELARPMPGKPDPSASPGEFGLVDNEDGSLTLTFLDPAGNPSPISEDEVDIKAETDQPNIATVEVEGFTIREKVAQSTVGSSSPHRGIAPSKGTVPNPKHPSSVRHAAPGSGAVATVTVNVSWRSGTPAPHTLSWKVTVVNDERSGNRLERGTEFIVNTV